MLLNNSTISISSNKLVDLHRSLHGLVRGDNMELGRDSDTGGQVQTNVTRRKLNDS